MKKEKTKIDFLRVFHGVCEILFVDFSNVLIMDSMRDVETFDERKSKTMYEVK